MVPRNPPHLPRDHSPPPIFPAIPRNLFPAKLICQLGGNSCKNGLKIGLGVTAVLVLAVVSASALSTRPTNEAAPVKVDPYANIKVDPDDNVFLKKQRPDSLADQRALIGQTVWISAGGQLDYYADKANHVDYAHPARNSPRRHAPAHQRRLRRKGSRHRPRRLSHRPRRSPRPSRLHHAQIL